MKIPAVTNVDECTSADTGVGAAIAAGSQLEYGNWALLVVAAIIIPRHIMDVNKSDLALFIGVKFILFSLITIAISKKVSPRRFVIIINMAALIDRELL